MRGGAGPGGIVLAMVRPILLRARSGTLITLITGDGSFNLTGKGEGYIQVIMAKLKTRTGVKEHRVVTQKAWLAARKALLVKEKKFTRLGDQLSRQRRQLPWVKVDKEYVFDGPNGPETLAELFDGKNQLFVYHFMFCPAC